MKTLRQNYFTTIRLLDTSLEKRSSISLTPAFSTKLWKFKMDDDATVTSPNFAAVEIFKGTDFDSNIRVSVPFRYLHEENQQSCVQFLKPFFTTDDIQMLPGFLKNANMPAPEDWSKFPCKIIKLFETFDESQALLRSMSNQKPFYSAQPKSAQPAKPAQLAGPGQPTKPAQFAKPEKSTKLAHLSKILHPPKPQIQPQIQPKSTVEVINSVDVEIPGDNGEDLLDLDDAIETQFDEVVEVETTFPVREDYIKESMSDVPPCIGQSNLPGEEGEGAKSKNQLPDPPKNKTSEVTNEHIAVENISSAIATVSDIKQIFKEMCENVTKEIKRKIAELDTKVTNIDGKVINIQKDVDELKTFTVEKRPFKEFEEILPLNKFTETHELNFPLKTMDEFISFKEKLANDAFKDLKCHFICTINTNYDLFQVCNMTIKKLLSREVIMSFTSQKQSKDKSKKLFKDTSLYQCLKESLMHCYKGKLTVDDKALCQTIGIIINNASDWDDYRAKRQRLNVQ